MTHASITQTNQRKGEQYTTAIGWQAMFSNESQLNYAVAGKSSASALLASVSQSSLLGAQSKFS